jgi:hypothetical protein
LLKLGRTNQAIIAELELTSPEAKAVIDYPRERNKDHL